MMLRRKIGREGRVQDWWRGPGGKIGGKDQAQVHWRALTLVHDERCEEQAALHFLGLLEGEEAELGSKPSVLKPMAVLWYFP